jgi:UDP-N-acetylmuramyl pentapeptide phosphotransferase/UDP-N-acetylglucosamine-1-phosphate transferase
LLALKFLDSITEIALSTEAGAAWWAFWVSFGVSILLVITKTWHGRISLDNTKGIQKFHTQPTPRIGGIAVVVAALVAWSHSADEVRPWLHHLIVAGAPALLFGLAEDVSKQVGVLPRLLATMASGALAWWITGYSLHRLDVWGVDALMQFTLISVLFTAFAVGGVANAINIVDGFNGLASQTAALAFVGYAVMAQSMGDGQLAGMSLILGACVWGFFWVNWPLGKIFLGDGGSYFIGFSLAWVAVMLIERHPTVSVFAVLLPCMYPVTEVLFSVYRRKVRKDHPGAPDRLHFHSIVKRRYVARWFRHQSTAARNSITGLLVGSMTLPAVILAYLTAQSLALSIVAVLLLGMGYVTLYARMVKHRWCSPVDFLLFRPVRRSHFKSL